MFEHLISNVSVNAAFLGFHLVFFREVWSVNENSRTERRTLKYYREALKAEVSTLGLDPPQCSRFVLQRTNQTRK